MLVSINNLSTGAGWKDTPDTWSSAKTWETYTDITSLTNLE